MALSTVASVSLGTGSIACFSRAWKYSHLSKLCEFTKPLTNTLYETPGYRISRLNYNHSIIGYHDGMNFVNFLSYAYPTSINPQSVIDPDDIYTIKDRFKSQTRLFFAGGAVCLTLAGYLL